MLEANQGLIHVGGALRCTRANGYLFLLWRGLVDCSLLEAIANSLGLSALAWFSERYRLLSLNSILPPPLEHTLLPIPEEGCANPS